MLNHSVNPDTSIGAVHLTVSDLERSLSYYQDKIGLDLHRNEQRTASLGSGGKDLLYLNEKRGARLAQKVSGLYHFALLLPSRLELAKTITHLVDSGTSISGSADHAVSEAIYLSDPDGHGIEIYRDRPRNEWEYQGESLRITTEPLDAQSLLREMQNGVGDWKGLHRATTVGHVHLHVADLSTSEAFYVRVMGFDLVARYGPSASFVSAGGYHHHIGMNTWAGRGVPPPPPEALGLRYFSVHSPDEAARARLIRKIELAGITISESRFGPVVSDPSSNRILLTT
jgi:catechol 2,3-dioxygenase